MLGMSCSLKHTAAHGLYYWWILLWQPTSKSMLKPVYLLYFLVLTVCLVFFLMVLSNFLRGCSKPWEHQQKIDTYLDGAQPNLELCSILLNLLLLLLKDAGVHRNKTLIKPQKTKTRTFSIMFLFEVHALLFGLIPVSVTWESPVWKGFRLENLKSDIIRIQYPRFSKNMSWIQGRNLGSGSKIQDLRFWKACVGKPWIQQSHLDPRFLLWIQEKFFENIVSWILDSCALGSEVWQLSRLEIPSLRSHLLSLSLMSFMYM